MNPRKMARFDVQDLVVYEDKHLLVLNKPLNVSTLSERNQPEAGLLNRVRELYPNAQAAHRLDKHTTGALLFALNGGAYRNLALQFQRREVEKSYLALTEAMPPDTDIEITAPIGLGGNNKARVDFAGGKPAQTQVTIETQYRDYSLLRCRPITGRTHQIRVHLAYIGFPIVGDLFYGGEDFLLSSIKRKYRQKREEDERPLNYGYLLHASTLAFKHPGTGQPVQVTVPLAPNFAMIVSKLDKLNAL